MDIKYKMILLAKLGHAHLIHLACKSPSELCSFQRKHTIGKRTKSVSRKWAQSGHFCKQILLFDLYIAIGEASHKLVSLAVTWTLARYCGVIHQKDSEPKQLRLLRTSEEAVLEPPRDSQLIFHRCCCRQDVPLPV